MARFITTIKTIEEFLTPINIDLVIYFRKSIGINVGGLHEIQFYCSGQKYGEMPIIWLYKKEEDMNADYEEILKEFGYPLPNLSIIEEEIEPDSGKEHKGGDNDDRPSGLDWLLANR